MDLTPAYLVAAVIICTAMFASRSERRWMWAVLLVPSLAGLAVTFYRSAWLALVVGLAVLFFCVVRQHRRWMLAAWLAALLGVGLALASATMVTGRTPAIARAVLSRGASIRDYSSDVSAQHRLREWQAALEMIKDHPVVGNGLGARVEFESPMYSSSRLSYGYWSRDYYIHNSYIWFAVKLGVVGLLLLLGLLAVTLRQGVLGMRRSDRVEARMATAILAALLVMAFFGEVLSSDNVTPLIGIVMAALVMENVPATGSNDAVHAGRS
jgi:O-antigen ligase